METGFNNILILISTLVGSYLLPISISIATYIALVCNKERIWKNRIDIKKNGDVIEHNPKSLNPGKDFAIMKIGNKELCDDSISSTKSSGSNGNIDCIVTVNQQEYVNFSKRSSNENLSLVPDGSDLKSKENITSDFTIVIENIDLPKLDNNIVSVVHESEIRLKDSLFVVGEGKDLPKNVSELKVNKNMPKDSLLLVDEIDNQNCNDEINKETEKYTLSNTYSSEIEQKFEITSCDRVSFAQDNSSVKSEKIDNDECSLKNQLTHSEQNKSDIIAISNMLSPNLSLRSKQNQIILLPIIPANDKDAESILNFEDESWYEKSLADFEAARLEERRQSELKTAKKSIETNVIICLIFFVVYGIFILMSSCLRQSYSILVFSILKGVLPVCTTIANFGTVSSVLVQYWNYANNFHTCKWIKGVMGFS